MPQRRKSSAEKIVLVAEQPRRWPVVLAALLAGAALMWVAMHFLAPRDSPKPHGTPTTGAPDVSAMTPAQAAVTLGNWEYDHAHWAAAVQRYEAAIAAGLDTADVRTDLGTAYRELGEGDRALAQYGLAQRKDPFHQNSLFNQIIVYSEVKHDRRQALTTAREFIRRFPQSAGAATVRQMIAELEADGGAAEKKLNEFLTSPTPVRPAP